MSTQPNTLDRRSLHPAAMTRMWMPGSRRHAGLSQTCLRSHRCRGLTLKPRGLYSDSQLFQFSCTAANPGASHHISSAACFLFIAVALAHFVIFHDHDSAISESIQQRFLPNSSCRHSNSYSILRFYASVGTSPACTVAGYQSSWPTHGHPPKFFTTERLLATGHLS